MRYILSLLMLTILAIASTVAQGEIRTWTNFRGATMEGSLVRVEANNAIIDKADGKQLSVPLNRLSREDQIYARAKVSGSDEPVAEIPEALKELFGEELTNKSREDVSVAALADKEKIGIYFSGHWCPPCRAFTPQLVDAYEKLRDEGKPFEVVFVSSDRDKKAMRDYMKEAKMPWLAVPFNSDYRDALKKRYQIRGIPALVVIDKEGKTLSRSARNDVASRGADAYSKW